MEPLTVAISGGVGAAAGALILYIIMSSSRRSSKETGDPEILSAKLDVKRFVHRAEIERARRDLNAILLEKDLVSGALTRVYEAEVDGRISRPEREELSSRYKKRLKEVEEKLGDAEITIEVGELERLREELVSLFERKMQQIDSRLQDARIKLDRMTKSAEHIQALEDVEKKPRAVKKSRVKTQEAEVDEKVKALREEVLEALARLEQMDIEG